MAKYFKTDSTKILSKLKYSVFTQLLSNLYPYLEELPRKNHHFKVYGISYFLITCQWKCVTFELFLNFNNKYIKYIFTNRKSDYLEIKHVKRWKKHSYKIITFLFNL